MQNKNQTYAVKLPGLGRLLKETLILVKKSFWKLLLVNFLYIGIIPILFTVITFVITSFIAKNGDFGLFGVLLPLVISVSVLFLSSTIGTFKTRVIMIRFNQILDDPNNIDKKIPFKKNFIPTIMYIILFIAFWLSVLFGTLLFIIPGIFIFISFLLTKYTYCLEEKNILKAVKTTFKYMEGYKFSLMTRIIFLPFLVFLLHTAFSIVLFVIILAGRLSFNPLTFLDSLASINSLASLTSFDVSSLAASLIILLLSALLFQIIVIVFLDVFSTSYFYNIFKVLSALKKKAWQENVTIHDGYSTTKKILVSLVFGIWFILAGAGIIMNIIGDTPFSPNQDPPTPPVRYPINEPKPTPTIPDPTPDPIPTPITNNNSTEGISEVVEANNQFAIDLYSEYKSEKENVFFSPYSISTALAMTYEGARGQTAQEMQSVLHFPKDDQVRRLGYSNLYSNINNPDKEYVLNTANALWAEKSYTFIDNYFNIINTYHKGNVTNLDFVNDLEKSRLTINSWVESKTNDKIKDLIPPGAVSEYTRLVLTNAIYFKSDWAKQFKEVATRDAMFRNHESDNIEVEMMTMQDYFRYGENENAQILELPYSGNDLSMLILLPKNDDIETLENLISTKKLTSWQEELKRQEVITFIPKFKFETKYFMSSILTQMGMPTAFSDDANFSGMTKNNLLISEVIHQTFIEVGEDGTEAAAATAVIMRDNAALPHSPKTTPPTFRADHPFVFIIQQKDSGNILFMGKVVNPGQK